MTFSLDEIQDDTRLGVTSYRSRLNLRWIKLPGDIEDVSTLFVDAIIRNPYEKKWSLLRTHDTTFIEFSEPVFGWKDDDQISWRLTGNSLHLWKLTSITF